jgi:excisionase family DNA binding protein
VTPFEAGLRSLIADVVRDEVRRALADHAPATADLLTVAEAADAARVSAATVRRWIRTGQLAAQGDGRRLRVRRRDLDQLLTAGPRRELRLTPEQIADQEDMRGPRRPR